MILQLATGYALRSFQDQHGEIILRNFRDLTLKLHDLFFLILKNYQVK
jgi:hypothetical protein